jgi:hypothetical protein
MRDSEAQRVSQRQSAKEAAAEGAPPLRALRACVRDAHRALYVRRLKIREAK